MNFPNSVPFRIARPLCIGAVGIALGWCVRDFSYSGAGQPSPFSTAVADAATRSLSAASAPTGSKPVLTANDDLSLDNPVSIQEVLDRIVVADSRNMINLIEAMGELTRLSNEQVREAWSSISKRTPMPGMGGSAAVIYLWGRMTRMGVDAKIPNGWGAENFASTIAIERSREQVPELQAKLEAGQALTDIQRRLVFTSALRTDPYRAVMLWMKHTKPWDFQADGKIFGNALSDPTTRDAIMAEARKWQTDKD
ncbi:MAG: hypothetical protein EOP84_07445, partial [Verrucomicrobiaceae bacterium]